MIAIIDYGMGNVKSILNALEYIGYDAVITYDKDIINKASHIILPGVGAFKDAMDNLQNRKLIDILYKEIVIEKKPFLGICLGMQLLADYSREYGWHKGLGFIGGNVVKMDVEKFDLKVPHVGWNDIEIMKKHPVFKGLDKTEQSYYFVHSYCFEVSQRECLAASCTYGIDFAAAVIKENIIATQFHPEKSQDNGLQFLDNFASWRGFLC
jgi:glutamine amidotransferase